MKKKKAKVSCNGYQEYDFIDFEFDEQDHFNIKMSKYMLHEFVFAIDFHYYGKVKVYNKHEEMDWEYPLLRITQHLITLVLYEKHTGTKYFYHINI